MNEIYQLRDPAAFPSAGMDGFKRIRDGSDKREMLDALVVELREYGWVRLGKGFSSNDFKEANEINLVLKGRGVHETAGKSFQLRPGKIFLSPGFRGRINRDCENLEKIYFHFRLLYRGVDIFYNEAPLSFTAPGAFASRLALFQKNWKSGGTLSVKAILFEILSYLEPVLLKILAAKKPSLTRHEAFFRMVRDRIHQNPDLRGAAQAEGRTEKAFSAAFQRSFGVSPKQYFLREKCQRIQEALAHSDQAVGKIAEAFGFSDPYYFSRFFKKMTGITPLAYRKKPQ